MSKIDSNGLQHNEVSNCMYKSDSSFFCNMMEQVPVYTRLIAVVCSVTKQVCVRTRLIAMVCKFCETGKYMYKIDKSGMQHNEASTCNAIMLAV